MGEIAEGIVAGEWCELCNFPFHHTIRPLGHAGRCTDCGGKHRRMGVVDPDYGKGIIGRGNRKKNKRRQR